MSGKMQTWALMSNFATPGQNFRTNKLLLVALSLYTRTLRQIRSDTEGLTFFYVTHNSYFALWRCNVCILYSVYWSRCQKRVACSVGICRDVHSVCNVQCIYYTSVHCTVYYKLYCACTLYSSKPAFSYRLSIHVCGESPSCQDTEKNLQYIYNEQ